LKSSEANVGLKRAEVLLEIIQFLVQQWPESLQKDSDGWEGDALKIAVCNCRSDHIIHYLIQQCPNSVKKYTENGDMVLHCACANFRSLPYIPFLAEQWPEAVKIKTRSYSGGLPLQLALHHTKTSVETIAFLIDMWPESVKEKDLDNNETCLLKALKYPNHENVEVIFRLIEQWPDAVSIPDKIGNLPLHYALLHGAPLEVLNLMVKTFPESVRV